MTHPPALVQRAADALVCGAYATDDDVTAAAIAVLDALVVPEPNVVSQADGRIRLDWPDGLDPDRSPTAGTQHVLVDVRLLGRLVDQLNERGAALDLLREQYQTPIEHRCRVIKTFAWGAGGVFCTRRFGHTGPHFNHGQEWE